MIYANSRRDETRRPKATDRTGACRGRRAMTVVIDRQRCGGQGNRDQAAAGEYQQMVFPARPMVLPVARRIGELRRGKCHEHEHARQDERGWKADGGANSR